MKEYRDHYFLKAKEEHYPARSVYKLKEIDSKFKIFRRGMRVLDLGAAPGSWSLGAAEKVGPQGLGWAVTSSLRGRFFPPRLLSCRRMFSTARKTLKQGSGKWARSTSL